MDSNNDWRITDAIPVDGPSSSAVWHLRTINTRKTLLSSVLRSKTKNRIKWEISFFFPSSSSHLHWDDVKEKNRVRLDKRSVIALLGRNIEVTFFFFPSTLIQRAIPCWWSNLLHLYLFYHHFTLSTSFCWSGLFILLLRKDDGFDSVIR